METGLIKTGKEWLDKWASILKITDSNMLGILMGRVKRIIIINSTTTKITRMHRPEDSEMEGDNTYLWG